MIFKYLYAKGLDFLHRSIRRIRMYALMPLFAAHGKKFIFDPDGYYSFDNIYVGDYVSLGYHPVFMAEKSKIRIGNYVLFGTEVVMIGGGHNITVVGRPIYTVHEKTGNEDLGIIVEDDVWVGTRVVILRGVTIGRGAVIGAGSVVTKSVPPYAIVGGNPARVLRFRWDVETIVRHECQLYSREQRLDPEMLNNLQAKGGEMLPPIRCSNVKEECS